MRINKVHCLFEQSGTFKNAFKKMGIDAEDYDILNDFDQTDNVIDLFGEIDKAYAGEPSLFDNIGDCDLVFAFFPCTRFQAYANANLQGTRHGCEKWDDMQKLEYSMKLHNELNEMYIRICKLFHICMSGGWRMIVENPYTQPHYLTMYFPIKPAVVDKDRTENGDHFKKPTQYWFVNCSPENNFVLEPLEYTPKYTIANAEKMGGGHSIKVRRSLIHPQYAERFIKRHILTCDGGIWEGG